MSDTVRNLSNTELDEYDESIRKERTRRYEERIAKETAELKRIAAEKGFLVEEIFSGKRINNAPKYRHPTDATLTWSGRGRRPHWLNEFIANGSELDDLLVS